MVTQNKFLENVPSDKTFGFGNGKIAHNLEELYSIISESEEKVFSEHVDVNKNDFANWIKYCVLHIDFADKLSSIKDRSQFLKVLNEEINALKNSSVLPAGSSDTSLPANPISVSSVSASTSIGADSATAQDSIASQVSSSQIPVTPNVSNEALNTNSAISEQKFDFEEIFQSLIDDIEKEIFVDEV